MTEVLERDDYISRYVWVGAVTDKSFKIFVDVRADETQLLVCKSNESFDNVAYRAMDAASPTPGVDTLIYGRLRHFHVGILEAATRYSVGLMRSDGIVKVAEVTTFPSESSEVVLAIGSCQEDHTDIAALDEIAQWREAYAGSRPQAAFLMLHMGDLHYANIKENDPLLFATANRNVVSNAKRLFRTTPVAYTWDDHDYGYNNSNADAPARPAALATFHAMVPKPSPDIVYHAFTVANVRVIVSDLRSEAVSGSHLMAPEQLRFLLDELQEHRKYDAIVWVSSRPWIERPSPGSDRWGGFVEQRREIANYIAAHGVTNLMLVSGDAHMIAADDGSNSCYADEKYGTRGFPVFHAAPLSNQCTVKGGPYSEGTRTRPKLMKTRQYGILHITPSEGRVDIKFNGYRVGKKPFEQPMLLLKKQPILRFESTAPFLTEKSKTPDKKQSPWKKCWSSRTRPVRTKT